MRKKHGKTRIGVLGGSFDPIHSGHIHCALFARKILKLDKVIFVPCHTPPHKTAKNAVASAWDRYAMIMLGIFEYPFFEASTTELEKGEKMFALQTLKEIERKNKNAHIFYLIGTDSLYDIPTWWRGRKLVNSFDIAVLKRNIKETPIPSWIEKRIRKWDKKQISIRRKERAIYILSNKLIQISSTKLRRALSAGKNPRRYIPANIFQYIKKRGLYLGKKEIC